MRLMPFREVDFEPSIYDPETGLAIAEYVSAESSSMRYEDSGDSFGSVKLVEPRDIHIYLERIRIKKIHPLHYPYHSTTHPGMSLVRVASMRPTGRTCFRQVS